jgi:hypothetical protein
VWDDLLGVLHEFLELFRLDLVHNGNPALKVGSDVLWVNVDFDPTHVCLNNGALVPDPFSLGVFMSVDGPSTEVLNVERNHVTLVIVGCILAGLGQVIVNFFKIRSKLSIGDCDFHSLEGLLFLGLLDGAHSDLEVILA